MASALIDESISEKKTDQEYLEELKKKAFVPKNLPEDFLRIYNSEETDNLIARQLDYDLNQAANYAFQYPTQFYQRPVDYGRGKLQIDVVEAKLNKNYGLTRMDPYVRLKIGNKILETPTAPNGSKNPIWKRRIICNLPHNVDTITIEIFDEKSFTEDELIAFVKFPLSASFFDGVFLDEWIPLSGRLGEHKEGYINLHMQFEPHETLRGLNSRLSSSLSSSSSNSPSSLGQMINQPNRVNLPPTESVSIDQTNYSQEIFKSIKEMFPSFDDEVIKSIYESSRFNKDTTVDVLLQMAADA